MNTITVYLGSSGRARPVFRQTAEELGQLIAKDQKKLVYGGMDAGLMGVLARSALQAGGHVTGIVPKRIKDSERILSGLSETTMVEDLCDRKKDMFLIADAIMALPGGFGTLDESLEALYWAALNLHTKPLILVNTEGYWDHIITHLQALPDFDKRFLIIVDDVKQALPALNTWTPLPPVHTPRHLPHFEDEITRGTDEPLLIRRATLENTYFIVCALGLKQLGKHQRPIGFLNPDGRFDGLLSWFETAEKETFITEKCLKLFDVGEEETELRAILQEQETVEIDLHTEKWGE